MSSKSILLLAFVFVTIFAVAHGMVSINGPVLKHITTSVNYIWGVDPQDHIFICPRPCSSNTTWRRIPGGLKQIDAGEEEVWGVSANDHIWKRPVDGSGSWTRIPGGLKHVTASGNGYIWGVNRNDQIYKCKKPCSGSWQNVPGRLKQIDGGYGYIYGVNSANAIYTRPVDGSGTWRRIPGSLKHVTASGRTEIFGVNNNNNLFRCKKPCVGEWELVDNVYMTQCDATFDSFVGIRVQSQNYKHVTGI